MALVVSFRMLVAVEDVLVAAVDAVLERELTGEPLNALDSDFVDPTRGFGGCHRLNPAAVGGRGDTLARVRVACWPRF